MEIVRSSNTVVHRNTQAHVKCTPFGLRLTRTRDTWPNPALRREHATSVPPHTASTAVLYEYLQVPKQAVFLADLETPERTLPSHLGKR